MVFQSFLLLVFGCSCLCFGFLLRRALECISVPCFSSHRTVAKDDEDDEDDEEKFLFLLHRTFSKVDFEHSGRPEGVPGPQKTPQGTPQAVVEFLSFFRNSMFYEHNRWVGGGVVPGVNAAGTKKHRFEACS